MNTAIKIIFRVLTLPFIGGLTLVSHLIGWVTNLVRWVRNGGEAIIYTTKDKQSIYNAFNKLNNNQ
jgi:hypothetical protein